MAARHKGGRPWRSCPARARVPEGAESASERRRRGWSRQAARGPRSPNGAQRAGRGERVMGPFAFSWKDASSGTSGLWVVGLR